MCGIVGFLNKSGETCAVGMTVFGMLNALGRRGPDSTGVAIYGPVPEDQLALCVKVGEDGIPAGRVETVLGRVEAIAPITQSAVIGDFLKLRIRYEGELDRLEKAIEGMHPEIEVVSIGKAVELVKQVGSPERLDTTYQIKLATGTHAIGHTRLSTESKVDLSHSQPFWAHGSLDLASAHNGHITNYHKLRRQYEMRGVRFYTENDSEIIGLYLRDRMAEGATFEEALLASLRDFDGSFSYVAATRDQIGFVKDAFGLKPLMITETDAYIAIATEEQALCAVFGQDVKALEPPPGAMQVWSLPGASDHTAKQVAA